MTLLGTTLRVRDVLLRNRIVSAPMERNYGNLDGTATERYVAYLRARAAGPPPQSLDIVDSLPAVPHREKVVEHGAVSARYGAALRAFRSLLMSLDSSAYLRRPRTGVHTGQRSPVGEPGALHV
jgi:hypothetical protein